MTRLLLTLSLACLAGCGTPEEGPPELDPAPGPAFDAEHGGVLIGLDGPVLEVVVHATGEIHAHLRTAGDLSDGGLTLTLEDDADTTHAVAMHWMDDVQGFVGHMEGTPAAGDVRALLVRDGHRHTGRATVETVLPAPHYSGSVLAVGDHTVEVTIDPAGAAHLYVLDDPDHRLEVDLVLNIGGQDGHLHPLAMVWDEETGHYTGHIEGMHPTPGPLEVIWSEGDTDALGQGSLLDVSALSLAGAMGQDVPSNFQLDLPNLGTNVPAVIPVPDGEAAPEGGPQAEAAPEGEAAP